MGEPSQEGRAEPTDSLSGMLYIGMEAVKKGNASPLSPALRSVSHFHFSAFIRMVSSANAKEGNMSPVFPVTRR